MSGPTDDLGERLTRILAGRYRVEAPIGRGGMATVFRAEDQRHDRPVALKVLHPELASTPELQARFLREVRFAARLVHPHILPVHDSGQQDGLLWFVMPYLPGETLRERLERAGPLPVDDVVRWTTTLASALDHAHAQGIVHRDIKPENILLVAGQPVLADFGVARAVCSACGDRLTEVGLAIGTPAYMSPEQATAEADLDGRSDQYSLACVVYELLTGQPPFAGGGGRKIIVRHIIEAPPPLLPAREGIPAGVEAAILKALAKEPAGRFETVTAFAQAMQAGADTSGARAPASPLPRDLRTIAVLPFVHAGPDPDDEYLSDGLTDELIQALSQVEGLRVSSRTSVYTYKGRAQDIRTIGAALGAAFVIEGTVRRVRDRLRIAARLVDASDGRMVWSGRYDRSSGEVLEVEEEIARTIVAALRGSALADLTDPPARRATTSPEAYHLYLRGRHAWNRRTNAGLDEALGFFEQAVALDPGFALAYTGLADVYTTRLDYAPLPVSEAMERARQEARRALALDDSLAEAHTSLAWVTFIYDWAWEEAERQFQRAITLDPAYATARQWHAWLLLVLGRHREAVAEARLALDLDPTSVSIRRSLGWLHHMTRKPDLAIGLLRRTIALDPGATETFRILGHAQLAAGQLPQAIATLEQAHRLEPEGASPLASLAAARIAAGDRRAARNALEQLESWRRTRYVSPVAFAVVHAARGDADGLFQAMEEAWKDRRGWLAYLGSEPLLDPYRTDARFREWLTRMRVT